MNNQKAKILRKIAGNAAGTMATTYTTLPNTAKVAVFLGNSWAVLPLREFSKLDDKTKDTAQIGFNGQTVLEETCARWIYQDSKKKLKS